MLNVHSPKLKQLKSHKNAFNLLSSAAANQLDATFSYWQANQMTFESFKSFSFLFGFSSFSATGDEL